jgi:tripartite-type tricarboxylate transporter receptor subunit TctC
MRTYAQTGKIKIIAINDRKQSPIAPDIPSVVESGFRPRSSVRSSAC